MTATLPESVADWRKTSFTHTLKRELERLGPGGLPLQQGSSRGGPVDDRDIEVSVIRVADNADAIHARVGIFFSEIIAGCSCGDEPMAQNAYCELRVAIDKATAEVAFEVVPE